MACRLEPFLLGVLAVGMAAAVGCAHQPRCWVHTETPNENVVVDGVAFRGSAGIDYGYRCDVLSGRLLADTTFDGIAYKGDTEVRFFHKESAGLASLRSGVLHNDTTINGLTYQRDTLIRFAERGGVEVGVLAKDATLDGIKYRAGTAILFCREGGRCGSDIRYAFGPVRTSSVVAQPELPIVDHIVHWKYPFRPRPAGDEAVPVTPVPGMLAEDKTIEERVADTDTRAIRLKANTAILFHGNSLLRSGVLARDTTIDHVPSIPWHFKSAFLDHGPIYAAGTLVQFHSDGQLMSGTLAYDTQFLKPYYSVYKGGTQIELYQNGHVKCGTLAIQNVYPDPRYPRGTPAIGHLYQYEVGPYHPGATVEFDEQGRLREARSPAGDKLFDAMAAQAR